VSNLPEQVEQTIRARGLFRRGQKILVAVSGGVDSMALLHVLHSLAKKNGWRITVAHLNHQLRGRSSDADERMVARVAKKLRVAVVAGRADVRKLARTGGLSLEMAARKARHEFLAQTAARLRISHIAVAHHADDQVELFFLRLLRGSGSEGLAGMRWRGASPANPEIQLVRPLLEQSKESLREYAAAKKFSYREDESNEWLDIQRNLIRRELLPLLRRKYQPALPRTILRFMEILRAESEFINKVAEVWLERVPKSRFSSLRDFDKVPLAIQRRCIQSQLLARGIPADFGLVERLRTSPGRPFTILPQVTVACGADGQLRFQESPATRAKFGQVQVDLAGRRGETLMDGTRISWMLDSRKGSRLPRPRPGREVFDADKVGSRIVLRHWRPGDRFQPIGMKQAVKLQDLFVNCKIPKDRRHELIVATTIGNEVFWVESLRISEQFKLTPRTTRQLTWRWSLGRNARLRVSAYHVKLRQLKNVRRK
jgi:tRNA(Ile)-lysidine synthase